MPLHLNWPSHCLPSVINSCVISLVAWVKPEGHPWVSPLFSRCTSLSWGNAVSSGRERWSIFIISPASSPVSTLRPPYLLPGLLYFTWSSCFCLFLLQCILYYIARVILVKLNLVCHFEDQNSYITFCQTQDKRERSDGVLQGSNISKPEVQTVGVWGIF